MAELTAVWASLSALLLAYPLPAIGAAGLVVGYIIGRNRGRK